MILQLQTLLNSQIYFLFLAVYCNIGMCIFIYMCVSMYCICVCMCIQIEGIGDTTDDNNI